MNLANIVRDNASKRGDRPAILFGEQSISYAEAWEHIERIAAFLGSHGAGRGDRIGLALKDHPLHLLAHFSIGHLGAVIVPMDHRWTEPEKKSAADAFATKLVLTDGDAIAGVNTLTLDESVLDTPLQSLASACDDPGDLLISLSSGTTGRPKGALVTHDNLHERFVSQWKVIGYGESDCFAILTPLFFGAGRSFAMCMLAAGGTLRLAPPPMKPPQVLEVLRDTTITATFLPPTLLRRLFDFHDAGQPPLLGHIRYLIVSGEPLHAEEAAVCIERICPNLVSYYASSEGGGISVLPARDFAGFAHTVGIPTYRTEVEIVDDNDEPLGNNEVGRLRYRGPGVARRMIDSDGTEKDTGSGGWFYPGDLAERLDSGHIALRGRDKDVIIRGGVNIYPAEIEAILTSHDAVTEAAVIGIDDVARGQVVRAYVATTGTVSESGLADYCRDRLAPYKVPNEFRFLAELPKRASGKVDKKALPGI